MNSSDYFSEFCTFGSVNGQAEPDTSLCFGFNEGNRALFGLLKEAFSLFETAA